MDSNALYYGDNLDILGRHVADESVDLVSLITSAMRFIWQRRPGMSRAVQINVRVGGLPPMLVQGMVVKQGRGYAVEGWRAFDVSDGELFPCSYSLSVETERHLVGLLKRSAPMTGSGRKTSV